MIGTRAVAAIGFLAIAALAAMVLVGSQALAQEPTPTPTPAEADDAGAAMHEACQAGDIEAMEAVGDAHHSAMHGGGDADHGDMHSQGDTHHSDMHGGVQGDVMGQGMMGSMGRLH